MAGVYNPEQEATYRADKRRALGLWAKHLMAAVEDRDATVVPIKQTAA